MVQSSVELEEMVVRSDTSGKVSIVDTNPSPVALLCVCESGHCLVSCIVCEKCRSGEEIRESAVCDEEVIIS